MSILDMDCDWYCDGCHAFMNEQDGFTTANGTWTCTSCGYLNDVSKDNIIPEEGSKGYVYETVLEDGTTEKIRYTKKYEVHDFDGPKGKASVYGDRYKHK